MILFIIFSYHDLTEHSRSACHDGEKGAEKGVCTYVCVRACMCVCVFYVTYNKGVDSGFRDVYNSYRIMIKRLLPK